MQVGAKRWCFTIQYIDDVKIGYTPETMQYLVYQIEVGEQGGYKHFQGYVEWIEPHELSDMQRKFGRHAKYQRARGSAEQNRKYCTKEATRWQDERAGPWEYGHAAQRQGERADLSDIADALLAGIGLADIGRKWPGQFMRYYKGFAQFQLVCRPPEGDRPVHVYILTGPTGSGKSKYAYDYWPLAFWKHGADGGASHWFDGYCGQQDVIWDDFTEAQASLSFLLRLLDRYPMSVQVKGGYVRWVPRNVVITTSQDPSYWYGATGSGLEPQLARRVNHILHFPLSPGCIVPCALCAK